jgi:uncharacterized membrane protein
MEDKTKHLVGLALAAALAASLSAAPMVASAGEGEKCYGVAKAGNNDCAGVTHPCAGQSREDGAADTFIYLPEGTCDKLAGGSTEQGA